MEVTSSDILAKLAETIQLQFYVFHLDSCFLFLPFWINITPSAKSRIYTSILPYFIRKPNWKYWIRYMLFNFALHKGNSAPWSYIQDVCIIYLCACKVPIYIHLHIHIHIHTHTHTHTHKGSMHRQCTYIHTEIYRPICAKTRVLMRICIWLQMIWFHNLH
jgi:hypothetical protein